MQYETIFYRIREVDIDGRFTLSNVAVVRINKSATISSWPNPFTTYVNISMFNSQNTSLKINLTDMAGRILKTGIEKVSRGSGQIRMNMPEQLPQGIYLLEITDINSGKRNVFKLEKK